MSAAQRLASRADKLAEEAENLASEAAAVANEALALLNTSGSVKADKSTDAVVAPSPFGLFLSIHETDIISGAFSSWFHLWGGIIGAAHSVEAWPQDDEDWPEWTEGLEAIVRPADLDAALFGCDDIPTRPPQALRVGDRVRIRGFPAGVTNNQHYEVRNGTAYLDRPEDMRNGEAPSWIIKFDNGETLAMGGMSGGVVTVVLADGSEVPVAILITQNGRADLDGDGIGDHSSDVVELIDVWTALMA